MYNIIRENANLTDSADKILKMDSLNVDTPFYLTNEQILVLCKKLHKVKDISDFELDPLVLCYSLENLGVTDNTPTVEVISATFLILHLNLSKFKDHCYMISKMIEVWDILDFLESELSMPVGVKHGFTNQIGGDIVEFLCSHKPEVKFYEETSKSEALVEKEVAEMRERFTAYKKIREDESTNDLINSLFN